MDEVVLDSGDDSKITLFAVIPFASMSNSWTGEKLRIMKMDRMMKDQEKKTVILYFGVYILSLFVFIFKNG